MTFLHVVVLLLVAVMGTGVAVTRDPRSQAVVEPGPVQGAINFAVTNTVGAVLVLCGIALAYARSGALNLAGMAAGFAGHADALVAIAFGLITVGFLVKAAIVPVHFWLPDAHAVAPTPVCMLFSGVMVLMGLFGVARVYWTAFVWALSPHLAGLRVILVTLGVVTAALGAVMASSQPHLKRLLAYSSVSHMGVLLCGIGLLDRDALGAVALYALGHGLVKAALFAGGGIVLHRLGGVDERRLFGRGRHMRFTAVLFVIGGLALAGAPPFLLFRGADALEHAARPLGYGWLVVVVVLADGLTAMAVLRSAARIFGGLGEAPDASDAPEIPEGRETHGGHGVPWIMLAGGALPLVAALGLGLWPGLHEGARRAAATFVGSAAYRAHVLGGASMPRVELRPPEPASFGSAAAAVGLAVLLAALTLGARERGARALGPVRELADGVRQALRRLHSGHVGDYVAFLTMGAALWLAALWLVVR